MDARALMVAISILVLVGGIFLFSNRGWNIQNSPPKTDGPILMLGDSLVEGIGASSGQSLPEQLGRLTNTTIVNYGVSGNTTRDGLARINDALVQNPRIVIVLLGGNDFLRKIPREETFANLEQIVTKLQSKGAVVIVLGVRSGLIGGGADDAFKSLAKRTGAAYMEDALAGVFGHSELMSDTIHPNDKGYAKIAKRLMPILEKYLPKSP